MFHTIQIGIFIVCLIVSLFLALRNCREDIFLLFRMVKDKAMDKKGILNEKNGHGSVSQMQESGNRDHTATGRVLDKDGACSQTEEYKSGISD